MPLIEAHITKVEQEIGSDWGRIKTDHDTVKELSTKRPDLLKEAALLKESGALAGIDYNEQVKRLDDGRTFRNFYYNGAAALHEHGNGSSAAAPGIDMVQPQARGEDPSRAWRIALQNGANLAVATMPLMPVDQRDFETQKKIAYAWAAWTYFTPVPASPGEASPRPLAYQEPDLDFDRPPPYTDDDIPL